jgi:hypothetical protein
MKKIDIEKFLSLETYNTDERLSRKKGSGGTQEVFTPYVLVKRICEKVPEEDWKNPEKTFLEPSFGNGQFVVYIVYKRLLSDISWKDTLSKLFGVELMADNVQETKERILSLFDEMEIEYDKEEAMKIMDHNLVCSDFFKWDFENWCPIKEQEPKKKPKSKELF